MTHSSRLVRLSSAACVLAWLALAYDHLHPAYSDAQTSGGKLPTTLDTSIADTSRANELIRRQPGFFVPNLAQWDHAASFVHRSGPMTLFLEDRGWVIDLVERPTKHKTHPHEAGLSSMHPAMPGEGEVDQKIRGVALRMTFEGDAQVPDIVGEKKLPGHHNYFLGNDESRWRTDVPLYGSIRYENLYPGIDLRLREANGVPEYDLLLQPGADLSAVTVHVEGGKGLSIANNGSLVIATSLGPLTQSVPKTWEVGADGSKREVVCNFTLLGGDRFGFAVPGWDGDTSLTIDPGLIWSTYLGGSYNDLVNAISVDTTGVVTVAGLTDTVDFPTTTGAYQVLNGNVSLRASFVDAFVSRLDPSKTGVAQLVYSTFLGSPGSDQAYALAVDASGVVTVAGLPAGPSTSLRLAVPTRRPITAAERTTPSSVAWIPVGAESSSSSTPPSWGDSIMTSPTRSPSMQAAWGLSRVSPILPISRRPAAPTTGY